MATCYNTSYIATVACIRDKTIAIVQKTEKTQEEKEHSYFPHYSEKLYLNNGNGGVATM